MDINLLREIVTVASFAAFLGIVWFAVHPRNRERFDEAAMLPLRDEEGQGR
ncbi:MAG TPA: cbb3-type cytochrome c oxidase subunit 3 [Usitatibacter sp.]|nr:cbb3-type cytochrome c oxidase subunit 3 [Usitatibacter sp.]